MSRGKILAVVGGQWGSEGKGVIVAKIAKDYQVHVRTGGTNAGHSFWHAERKWVMQTVPCGWVNPDAQLVIGAGGLIEPALLIKEVNSILTVDKTITNRLFVDRNCGIISPHHALEEGGVDGEMHKRIGSTGKGVGAARRDRLMRDPLKFVRFKEWCSANPDAQFNDGTKLSLMWDSGDMALDVINSANSGLNVLLEGTQGFGLDLIHGEWPYVTSNGCGAAQMAADAGIPPQWITEVMLVCRTMPIRVAGNSGPMPNETDWANVSDRVGKPVQEFTTVTKKVRRVSYWDEELVRRSVYLNGATQIALTFLDYLSPSDEGKTAYADLTQASKSFVEYLENHFHVSVPLIGTGGERWEVIRRG